MISLVMACYNGINYLKEQLESIEKQTLKPDECIIIDDGSSDGTAYFLKEYVKETPLNIKLIIHTENKGYKYTFFEAIFLTRGNIIFLADQDDIWDERKIEIMDRVLKNERIKVLNSNYYLVDKDKKNIKENICNRRDFLKKNGIYKISLKKVLDYNISMGCTMAFTGEVREMLSFIQMNVCECEMPHDWIINIIGASMDSLYYINERLIKYRQHSSNTIGLHRASTCSMRIEAYQNTLNQKRDIGKILVLLEEKQQKYFMAYLEKMEKSYVYRIEALKWKSLKYYLKKIRFIFPCTSIKTVLYDFFLITKKA